MAVNDLDGLDWDKGNGLLPAIVQDSTSGAVLMIGFMNRDALARTLAEERVVFFSRTKARLWMKGETSGHFLEVVDASVDCDRDAILVQARPRGPTCHTGAVSCFATEPAPNRQALAFLAELETTIASRSTEQPESSYTAKLLAQGHHRIAQKVGEEGVEVALAAVGDDNKKVVSESADLVFHLLVLLKSRGLKLADVVGELATRANQAQTQPHVRHPSERT
jgi:phosphoribosyl-ATP pyrophosphohydrolase/phosphoribosyl-AMP cyclohydrolase